MAIVVVFGGAVIVAILVAMISCYLERKEGDDVDAAA